MPGEGRLAGAFTSGQVTNQLRPFAFAGAQGSQMVTYNYLATGGNTMGAVGRASGVNNTLHFTAGGFIDSDDLFDLTVHVPLGGGSFIFGSPIFDSSDLGLESTLGFIRAAPIIYDLRPEVWSAGGARFYRFPLAISRDGEWRLPMFSQSLEYASTLPGGPFAITRFDVFTTFGPRTAAAELPTTGGALYQGESFGTYQDVVNGLFARVATSVRINADFGTRILSGVFAGAEAQGLDGVVPPTGLAFDISEIAFSAPLDATFTATTPVLYPRNDLLGVPLSGAVSGEFHGSGTNASSELGGSFSFSRPGVFNYAGVFATGRNELPGLRSSAAFQSFSSAAGASNFAVSSQAISGLSFAWARRGAAAADDLATLSFVQDGVTKNFTMGPTFGAGPYFGYLLTPSGGSVYLEGVSILDVNPSPIRLNVVERIAGRDLNYAGFGRYAGMDPDVYFAFGQRTTQMPTTGSAHYSGVLRGEYNTGEGSRYDVFGRIGIDANFASGAISGGTEVVPTAPAVTSSLNFTFAGSIAGSGFSSAFATQNNTLNGTIAGIFAGPNAPEVAGTFATSPVPSGASYAGGFVARQ